MGETQLEPCRLRPVPIMRYRPRTATPAAQPSTTWRTASLGSTLGPLRIGGSYSSEGMGMNRGCPWMTAADRCLGHDGGTAGEDDVARSLRAMVTSLTAG
jgi:hypothetical protein